MEKEIRTATFELSADEMADPMPTIYGYAAVFNELSEDLGGFREIIRPGAFERTLKTADVRALLNHDSNYVLGRNRAGTLEVSEDERGLPVAITPPDTQWARDLVTSVKRGDVNQMSFQFMVKSEDWSQDERGVVRELRDVDLYDVSIVTYPAYPQTTAEVRSKALALSEDGKDEGTNEQGKPQEGQSANVKNHIALLERMK